MFPFGIIDQVKHISSKPEPISELFNKNTDIDRDQTFLQYSTQVDKKLVSQCDRLRHRTQPFLQTSL